MLPKYYSKHFLFPVIHEEEVEYNAYQAKKRTHLSNELSQMSPTKLGGRRLDDDDIATMREKQERQARLDKKFDSIRKRVGYCNVLQPEMHPVSLLLGEKGTVHC